MCRNFPNKKVFLKLCILSETKIRNLNKSLAQSHKKVPDCHVNLPFTNVLDYVHCFLAYSVLFCFYMIKCY